MRFVHLQKFAGVIYDTARSSPPALSIYFFDEIRLAPQTVAISKWTVDSAICKLESCFYQVDFVLTEMFGVLTKDVEKQIRLTCIFLPRPFAGTDASQISADSTRFDRNMTNAIQFARATLLE
jgi:hypothetical protein